MILKKLDVKFYNNNTLIGHGEVSDSSVPIFRKPVSLEGKIQELSFLADVKTSFVHDTIDSYDSVTIGYQDYAEQRYFEEKLSATSPPSQVLALGTIPIFPGYYGKHLSGDIFRVQSFDEANLMWSILQASTLEATASTRLSYNGVEAQLFEKNLVWGSPYQQPQDNISNDSSSWLHSQGRYMQVTRQGVVLYNKTINSPITQDFMLHKLYQRALHASLAQSDSYRELMELIENYQKTFGD